MPPAADRPDATPDDANEADQEQEYVMEFRVTRRRHAARQRRHATRQRWVRTLGRALWWAVETALGRWGGKG